MTDTMIQAPSAPPPEQFHQDDITLEWVDKAMAEAMLAKNISNRHLRPGNVRALALDMGAGRWQQTHMPVAFDVDGNLIDGQHRLYAIIESDEPQWLIVVRNVAKSVQEVIDAGAARSAADALKLSGRVDKNHPAVAAAARIAILYGEGHHKLVRPSVNGARKVTNSEITAWVDEQNAMPEGSFTLMSAVATATNWPRINGLLSLSVTSFAFFLLGDVDYDKALDFFNSVDDLNFTDDDDPAKQLYDRLNEGKSKRPPESLRISEKLWFVVTAWNAYRTGEDLPYPFVKRLASGSMKLQNPKEYRKNGVKVYPLVPDPV